MRDVFPTGECDYEAGQNAVKYCAWQSLLKACVGSHNWVPVSRVE